MHKDLIILRIKKVISPADFDFCIIVEIREEELVEL
jgi:hypothetical protein